MVEAMSHPDLRLVFQMRMDYEQQTLQVKKGEIPLLPRPDEECESDKDGVEIVAMEAG